jgi:hypothetical protein
MFTRKQRQDKKEEAASATCFARLFLFVQGGVGWVYGFTAQKKVVAI